MNNTKWTQQVAFIALFVYAAVVIREKGVSNLRGSKERYGKSGEGKDVSTTYICEVYVIMENYEVTFTK